ncbi:ABC transporter ATP-binding protein [Actinoplanes sp. LDG1-06]|uniref:ABC transporter ATP-binding protein n=1 Tax=Paractinoplanes ovalisporus TaxID=2810368 RepID=A0ABS2AUB1_9ACTN|nr:ABC transporter ATP-binding protein [Actinoplanes ovalisporus]MBM2623442.1 ABC transporter ATP-binding protein [Actinoplanes ovalisporus]
MNDARLRAEDVTLAYDKRVVAEHLDVQIADGSFTVIVGPNACGKSTLLKSLARVLKPQSGAVYLDGQAIASYPSKQVAKQLGMLPQSPIVPGGIVVEELVARGRFAHQRLLKQWSPEDEAAVTEAMRLTEVSDLADRFVDELSGGQRQRVWLAMALAQQTPILLLDEPTTFLDLSHQFEVLDLCAELHEQGRTIVAVLHDLNHACRYATELIVMKAGKVIAQGAPAEVMTAQQVEDVFAMPCRVIDDPETGTPMVVPADRHRRRGARTPEAARA